MKENVSILVLAALVLGLGGLLLARPVVQVEKLRVVEVPRIELVETLGVNAGPDSYFEATFFEEVKFRKTAVLGGDLTTLLATSTATTLTAAQVCNSNLISWDVSGTSSTLTMASSSAVFIECGLKTGDRSIGFLLDNISGSGENILIAADATGQNLVEPSGGDVIIEFDETALIQYFITLASGTQSTADVIVTSLQAAD